jgi:thiol:disulfide interchange protein
LKERLSFAIKLFTSMDFNNMTKIYLFFILFGIACQACSQPATNNTTTKTPATTTAAATEQPKPADYVSEKEGWLVDLDEAYAISTKEKKPILVNFTGSDWCVWCKKLDADVFSKPEFQDWAKKNVVLLEADFPKRKQIPQKNQQQNYALQNAMGVTGYPTIWLMSLDKNPSSGQYNINQLGRAGYMPSATDFIATLDKFIHP